MKLLKRILRITLKTAAVLVVLAFLGFWTIRFVTWKGNIQTYYHEIELDDGPYVFWDGDSTARVMNVHSLPLEENPSGFLDILRAAASQQLPAAYETSEFTIDLRDSTAARRQIEAIGIAFDPYRTMEIPGAVFHAERIAAMGDVHGNYKHLLALLRNGDIVDSDLNWSWGTGHLVFVGDVFDKGPGVTETLWLIYKLEQQAQAAGGMVHLLLGNHEMMVLRGPSERRFRGRKYANIERELGTEYSSLYSTDSVLGRWLRTKNTVVKINELLFVHGGISELVVDRALTIDELNAYGRQSVDREARFGLDADDQETLELLESYWGPYEYRGTVGIRGAVGEVASRFSDNTDELSLDVRSEEIMKKILDFYGARRVVVGHSQVRTIQLLREGTVVAIHTRLPRSDVIDEASNAQMLLVEEDRLFRLRMTGGREALDPTG
jgi:hypothetical protein